MIKRLVDVCGALALLLLALPLLVVMAIAVKLDSTGPILFSQVRVGRGGRTFRLYKFRSMFVRAEPGAPITVGADPRVTRVGRLIRPSRLDELPQLLNVLKGDMSLVGPRPEAPAIVERYTEDQRAVLYVRPGITGPTQLMSLDESSRLQGGDATEHYVRDVLPRKLEMDLQYIRTRTFLGDLRLLMKTPLRIAQYVVARPHFGLLLKVTRIATDFTLVGVATYGAYLARFDGQMPQSEIGVLLGGLPFVLLAYASPFLYLRAYRSIWRYVGVADFWQVVKACLIGGGLTAAAMHLMKWPYPRTVLVLTPVFAILLLGGARLTWRSLATAFGGNDAGAERHRVVIVGAGRTGASLAREILGSPKLAYDVVGFVDDDRHLHGAMLHNLPVLGTTAELKELTQKYELREAIIAIPRPKLGDLRRIREACAHAGLLFKTLPSLGQLVTGDGHVRYLRKVDIADLLPRAPVPLQLEKLAALLEGKRVLVTGAGGSIGSELCRQIVRLGAQSLVLVERAENPLFTLCAELQSAATGTKLTAALADIKHVVRMSEIFTHFRPEIVFHAAAYKHVPMLEAHPTEAVLNNVVGTVRLANLAREHGVETFIFISTDKAVRPSNLMGATKRICELYLMALEATKAEQKQVATNFRIVRFGNVLGSAGSALPLFQRQIENGEPITITDPDVSRFFMTIEEAVGLVLESATLDAHAGIAVLDMGEPVKITALAEDLITALGLPPSDVPHEFIGLRPGEKLHEVLWDDVDEVLPSVHPRIAIVRPRGKPLKEMEDFVRQLEQLAVAGLVRPLLAKVQETIPSYPGALHVERESKKPLTPANGAPTRAQITAMKRGA